MENRKFDYDVLTEIQEHWSPRAYDSSRIVAEEDLMAILEAARYAPSCFNEQPWRYIIARTEEEKRNYLPILNAYNAAWASKAPVLLLILAKQTFAHNGKQNRFHQFDAGTSWGFLLLEAQRRGIITHAMGGFNVEAARKIYLIPDDMTIIAAVAVGYHGEIDQLDQQFKESEHPSPRLSIDEILYKY